MDLRGAIKNGVRSQPAAARAWTDESGRAHAPSALYARGVAENRWEDDPAQREATTWLDRIHDEFARAPPCRLVEKYTIAHVAAAGARICISGARSVAAKHS